MAAKKRVICCGNVAFDLITKKKRRSDITFRACPGGSVFNTAILLARLDLAVSMFAKTGKDFLGESLLRTMQRERIDTKYVFRDKDIKTGLAFARIDKKGNSSYLFYKTHGPQTMFKKTDIPASAFKRADVFHIGSWYSYSDHSSKDTLRFLKQAKKENTFTTYDPNWREGRIKNKKVARKRIKALLPFIDLLKLSGTDALNITGSRSLSSALKKLQKKAVVTLGDKGGFYWDGSGKMRYSALKVRVADTIGAGDAFTAGLIYRYCELGKDLFWKEMKTNLDFASSLAGLICTEHGATAAVHNLRQVKRFLKVKAGLSSGA